MGGGRKPTQRERLPCPLARWVEEIRAEGFTVDSDVTELPTTFAPSGGALYPRAQRMLEVLAIIKAAIVAWHQKHPTSKRFPDQRQLKAFVDHVVEGSKRFEA